MGIFNKNRDDPNDYTRLVREFEKIADGEPISREGVCSFFYDYFTYAGETIPVQSKDGYVFFHVENDDVIQEILSGIPSVQVADEEGRTIVSVLFKTGTIINWIQLVMDAANPKSFDLLSSIIKKKKIVVGLLNLIYGAIAKERTLTIPVPKDVIDAIKKAAG
jgi:hypothetical protein